MVLDEVAKKNLERGACPMCGVIAETVMLGADRWRICRVHGIRWWRDSDAAAPAQTAAEVAAVVRLLGRYRPLGPLDACIPLYPSAMREKLDDIRRALGITPAPKQPKSERF